MPFDPPRRVLDGGSPTRGRAKTGHYRNYRDNEGYNKRGGTRYYKKFDSGNYRNNYRGNYNSGGYNTGSNYNTGNNYRNRRTSGHDEYEEENVETAPKLAPLGDFKVTISNNRDSNQVLETYTVELASQTSS